MSKAMIALRNKIRSKCLASWHGETGKIRAAKVDALLDRIVPEYASLLGITQSEVLQAIESNRTYSEVNYYQESHFPLLDKVSVFESLNDFKDKYPSGKYTCPSCDGSSTSAYECDAGKDKNGKPCNWKSYGLFGTMGKGLKVVIKDDFLKSPKVHEIFMPEEVKS